MATILLLDDDPDEHLLLREDMADAGLKNRIEAFTRVEDAQAWLSQNIDEPTVILTDMSLGPDGSYEFIAAVSGQRPHCVVGVYSGAKSEDVEDRARQSGASFYMVKPGTLETLREAIGACPGFELQDEADGSASVIRL